MKTKNIDVSIYTVIFSIRSFFVVSTVALVVAGCGGGGSAPPNNNVAANAQGVVYPVVAGLTYSTNSGTGVVAADGSYSYKTNENVTFSAGGVTLNTVPAAANVTPLPLGNDVASTNLLRLLKALDTDHDLSNGITLPALSASSSTVDLTSEASVAAALASLSPTAILPIAADAQVATALASAKTTALQNMGAYGTTYNAIQLITLGGVTPQAYHPKDATVSLTSQPDWSTGSVSGTATLTLKDNSRVTFTFNNATGTYTALGMTQTYQFEKDWDAKSRIIYLYYGDSSACNAASVCGYVILRDNSQRNMPPVAGISERDSTFSPALVPGGFSTYTWCTYWTGPRSVLYGSKDFDGLITSVTLTSNKGKTVSMNRNVPTIPPTCVSEIYYANETPGVTVTVTDDEGATSTKTYGGTTGSASTLTLVGSVNSILAMNNDKSFDAGPVMDPNGTNAYYVTLIDGTSPLFQSATYYARSWTTGATGSATLAAGATAFFLEVFVDTVTGKTYLNLTGVKDTTAYLISGTNGGFLCLVSTSTATPSCASAGINLNRSAGNISFTNTPMMTLSGGAFTLNGSLSFTPF